MGRKANYPPQPATAAAANLRNVSPYHPLVADTFGDWAVEAGDKVTLTKDGASYTSPVHETTLTWNGQPKLEIVSNGNEERAPIEKMATKKYNSRGSTSGIRDASKLYTFEVNQKHLLYDVYNEEYGRLHACIEITSSALRALMEDWYNGLFGYLEMTASHLLVQFWGIYDGLSSQLELTRSALTVQFVGLYDGLRSDLELTRSRLKLEFDDAYNGLYSGLEMTASRLRIWFTGLYDGLNSELEMTRSRLYVHFWGLYDGLSGELEMTRSRFWLGFNGLYDGLHGELEMTRSRFAVAFDGLYDGLHGELEMTRSRLHVEFMGLYDGLSSELTFTRSRLLIEFQGLYDGLSSQFELTRSRMYVGFMGLYDGLNSSLEFTRSRLHVEFMGLYDGLSSQFELTRSRMYVGFMGLYDGMASQLEFTRSRLFTYFTDSYHGLEAYVESTASRWTSQLANFYEGLYSKVEQTASSWSAIVGSDGEIKPAKIQAAINKATGNSKITLSADHVVLDGDAFASYLEGRSIGVQSIMADQIILNGGGQLLFYQDSEIGDTEAANLIVDAYVDENNSNLLHLIHYDGTDTTFSKATTLTGAWDSGTYTVTASPQGNTRSTQLQIISPVPNSTISRINKSVSRQFKVQYGPNENSLSDTGFTQTISIDATSVYNYGWDDVVLNDPVWGTKPNEDNTTASNSLIVSASDKTNGTARSKSIPIALTIDTTNKKAKVSAGGHVRAIADIPSDATPVYYLQESWGTGNDSNKLLIGRTTSGNTTSFTHTITADATLSYNSTTHKYTATGKAKVDGSEKDSDTDTESTAQGYIDGWKDCYDTLDTTGTTATKTLSAGEQAVVSVKQKNKDGSVITRLSRTYTAPNPTITIDPSSVSPLDPGGSVTITAKKDGVAVSGQSVTVSARGLAESDISFRTSNFGEYSASLPSGYNTTPSITLSKATGYYTMVVDMAGNSTGKWYKVYIDASAVASTVTHTPSISDWNTSSTEPTNTYGSITASPSGITNWYQFYAKCGSSKNKYKLLVNGAGIWNNGWNTACNGTNLAFDYYPNSSYFKVTYPKSITGTTAQNESAYFDISCSNGIAQVMVRGTGQVCCSTSYSSSSGPTNHTGFYITVTQNAGGSKTVTCSVTYPASSSVPSFFSNGSTKQLYWY